MSEFTGKTYEMLKHENDELKRVNKVKHEMYEEQKKRAEVLQKALEIACKKIAILCATSSICHERNCPLKKLGCFYTNDCDNFNVWKDWALELARKEIEDEK